MDQNPALQSAQRALIRKMQDQLGAFPSQNGVILACVRAALLPFPIHYYHWSLFAFMPYCALHGIRGYDL